MTKNARRTLDASALRSRRYADRTAAALRTVHGRESLIPLFLVAEPDKAEALRRACHGVGDHFGAEDGRIFLKEGCLEFRVGNLGGEVPHEDGELRGLLYPLPARAPVQTVAQGRALFARVDVKETTDIDDGMTGG